MTAVLERALAGQLPEDPDDAPGEGEWDLLTSGVGSMPAPPLDPITLIRIPFDPAHWNLFKWIDARKGLGYTRENWEQASSETPELIQIAAAWLHIKTLPGYEDITPREVGERVNASQFDRAPDPKARTRF